MPLPKMLTLPDDIALDLATRVGSGEYANEAEVIREGLRALDAREVGLERRLSDIGVGRFETFMAAPEQTLGKVEAGARLRARIARRRTAGQR